MPFQNRNDRFSDEGKYIENFADEFLVICPRCAGMAKIIPLSHSNIQRFSPRQVICLSCVYRDTWDGNQISVGDSFDWYFRLPLWLQISCCGETLWAYNETHLNFIEQYVSAKLRQRVPNKNRSLASRLPNWIKSAKNRDEILKAIGKLRTKLP